MNNSPDTINKTVPGAQVLGADEQFHISDDPIDLSGYSIEGWIAFAFFWVLALNIFYQIRDVPGLKKKPSTSELLDWLKLLMADHITAETLRERDPSKLIPPLHGALLKNEQDVHLFERLAFLARRERN